VRELERDVLAHLHANASTSIEDIAAALGADPAEVRSVVDALVTEGHIEREGDRLVPDAASRTTPGLFIATERGDAQPVEVDLSADES
jgi:DNA-binding Lrp family transcriptional regulator